MSKKKVMFSPVTRLSGLLSVDVILDEGRIVEANARSTMLRGFEWIMADRHVTDAVYLTQRICGICSLAHGTVASYLLDELYDNDISENAQYLRNIMYGADFLQNHIRHFYFFSLPDFVQMPSKPPFQGQNLIDARLNPKDNERLVEHYFEAIKAAQKSHQLLALFGGKAPHQHSFVQGGVTVAPTADKINQAKALINEIREFVKALMLPDTELIARVYNDYFQIGITLRCLLSFGLFRFGQKNEKALWKKGVLIGDNLTQPQLELIEEDVAHSWFIKEENLNSNDAFLEPNPTKIGGYTFVKAVKYDRKNFEVGPLARMLINGEYQGGTSTMDRIYARSLETYLIVELVDKWLDLLQPGPPPLSQKEIPVKGSVTAVTDAMRGTLLHSARIEDERVKAYNIITPTAWNFSPKDEEGNWGPVESAIVGNYIAEPTMLYTILGRIIRSFDPCLSCATHVLESKKTR